MLTKKISPILVKEEKEILQRYFPQGIIAVDLETTGLSPLVDKIIEISAVKLKGDFVETFDQLINPMIPIPLVTISIHGITDDMVSGAPTLDQILPSFLDFTENLPIVAHNAQFDMGFIIYHIHQENLDIITSKVYCSCRLARKAFKEMLNHKLATIAKNLDIDMIKHHRALDDALASLRVFARSLMRLSGEEKFQEFFQDANIFDLEAFNMQESFDIPHHLRDLHLKCAQQDIIEIKYAGGSYKHQFRPLRALSLLPLPQGNVLYAHCLLSGMHKSFLLKKIVEWRNVPSSYKQDLMNELKKEDS